MNTTAPHKPTHRLMIDQKSGQVHQHLNTLLSIYGLSIAQARDALSAAQNQMLIESDPSSKVPQYYLPILLIPDFIDQILDLMPVECRARAIECRDASRELQRSATKQASLTQSSCPNVQNFLQERRKINPMAYLVLDLAAAQHKQPASGASAHHPGQDGQR